MLSFSGPFLSDFPFLLSGRVPKRGPSRPLLPPLPHDNLWKCIGAAISLMPLYFFTISQWRHPYRTHFLASFLLTQFLFPFQGNSYLLSFAPSILSVEVSISSPHSYVLCKFPLFSPILETGRQTFFLIFSDLMIFWLAFKASQNGYFFLPHRLYQICRAQGWSLFLFSSLFVNVIVTAMFARHPSRVTTVPFFSSPYANDLHLGEGGPIFPPVLCEHELLPRILSPNFPSFLSFNALHF